MARPIPDPHAAALRAIALAYPDVTEDHPWGESAFKIRGKVFLFLSEHGGVLSLSTKLPHSSFAALMFPFAAPTGYGLGKSGWVSARFEDDEVPPIEVIRAWIDESFRAIAPKKVVAGLAPAVTPAATATATATKPTATKPAAKSTATKPAAKSSTSKPAAKSTASKPASKRPAKPAAKPSAAKPARPRAAR